MTDYEIKLPSELVSSLMSEGNGFAQLLTGLETRVLEAPATEQIGAGPYERSERRGGDRNGMRARTLYTRVGPLTLRVPQFRDGSFSTGIFGRYQRSDQAFVLGLMAPFGDCCAFTCRAANGCKRRFQPQGHEDYRGYLPGQLFQINRQPALHRAGCAGARFQ